MTFSLIDEVAGSDHSRKQPQLSTGLSEGDWTVALLSLLACSLSDACGSDATRGGWTKAPVAVMTSAKRNAARGEKVQIPPTIALETRSPTRFAEAGNAKAGAAHFDRNDIGEVARLTTVGSRSRPQPRKNAATRSCRDLAPRDQQQVHQSRDPIGAIEGPLLADVIRSERSPDKAPSR